MFNDFINCTSFSISSFETVRPFRGLLSCLSTPLNKVDFPLISICPSLVNSILRKPTFILRISTILPFCFNERVRLYRLGVSAVHFSGLDTSNCILFVPILACMDCVVISLPSKVVIFARISLLLFLPVIVTSRDTVAFLYA